jgi:hypothetical protein
LWLAILGPAVALLAALIAFVQWRTAHQKVVLDLFDRRFKVYEETDAVLRKVMAEAKVYNHDFGQLAAIRSRAQFLFGYDLDRFLAMLLQTLADMQAASDEMEHLPVGPERTERVNRKWEGMEAVQRASVICPSCVPAT